jgi:hypothetical protein
MSNHRRLASFSLLSALLVGGVGISLTGSIAKAQSFVVARSTGGPIGAGGATQISSRSVERYAALLGLSDQQKELAKQLHEGYQASFRSATDEMQRAMEETREAYEETQDASVFMEKMPAVQRSHKQKTTAIEAQFMDDLKAILDPAQAEAWSKVERQRRRETILRGGQLSGESVDLLEIVEGLGLDAAPPELTEALDQYELDLDRALVAKKAVLDAQGEFNLNGGPLDLDSLRKHSDAAKAAGTKVKEVNEQHARKVESIVPESKRVEFAGVVKRQSFPRVFRPSQVVRAIDQAMKFDDLDATQKRTIQSLREAYERDVAPLNDAWASAIEEDEKDPDNMSLGDGAMQVKIGSPEDEGKQSPLDKARKARREFDDATRERLLAALTPAQREKLPKRSPGGPMGDMEEDVDMHSGGGGVFVAAPR